MNTTQALTTQNIDQTIIQGTQNHSSCLLQTPVALKAQYPLAHHLKQQIAEQRATIEKILSGEDPRLMIIMGPCSIHDPIAVLDYANKLKQLQKQVSEHIFIVMRAYIEKPRTTVGWKGFLYDPELNDSANIQLGLQKSRELYLQLIALGLPIASEILNPIATQYFDDLLAWGAIGARTSESQIHREISSLMPFPIGFKNGTDGSIQIALDAIQSAQYQHQFIGLDQQGQPAILSSTGNPSAHLILRGANHGSNYDLHSILALSERHTQLPALVIDCSHGNSAKNPLNQIKVLKQIIAERAQTKVRGVMLESFLVDGQQKICADMQYGQSITDGCLGWEKTHELILHVNQHLAHSNLKQLAYALS